MQKTFEQRFWDKVVKTNYCWNWVGSKSSGYGTIFKDGRTQRSHRVSYAISNGEIPDGLFACHKCDNRSCVNPEHIFLGTQVDNMRDCISKNRHSKYWSSRLTCKIGHNKYVFLPNGERYCYECHLIRARENNKKYYHLTKNA